MEVIAGASTPVITVASTPVITVASTPVIAGASTPVTTGVSTPNPIVGVTDPIGKCDFDLEKENVNGMFTNMTLLTMLLASLTKDRKPLKCKPKFGLKEEYDYVIVGGGTAGSVVANRLSELPCVSVLLLEAGGVAPFLSEVPAYQRAFFNSKIDWRYKTVPQKHCAFAQEENRVIWNSGKGLGGGSSLNSMLYIRGNHQNYDDWVTLGATGWSYEEVFPYFLKLEDNADIPKLDSGTCDLQATVRNQQRCSTAKAYLEPAADRPNLDILIHAFVTKILMDGKTAVGVEFDLKGKKRIIRATREVILCNGATRTPQLLMLSGIGPEEELEKHNITTVLHLSGVGQNLQDHYAAPLLMTLDPPIMPVVAKVLCPANIAKYVTKRQGPLCAPNQVTLLNFGGNCGDGLNTSANSTDFPCYQLFFAEYAAFDALLNLRMKIEVFTKVLLPYLFSPMAVFYSQILQPHSRGEITLSSADPHDPPIIDPKYYSDPRDIECVVEGMKVCKAIAEHPAMKAVGAKLVHHQKTGFPNCEKYENNSTKYLKCIARSVTCTIWHPSGTCKMGSTNDSMAVVNPKLLVIGTDNLRVVSAAVFPKIPSGNTNVPVMMVAEKASDMIKENVKCNKL